MEQVATVFRGILATISKVGSLLFQLFRLAPWIPVIIVILFSLQGCVAVSILRSYFAVFGDETVVAEVIMNPIKNDGDGNYIEIEFTPLTYSSAFDAARSGSDSQRPSRGEPQKFKVYGDTVAVRGPLVTLHSVVQLLSFENIYKLGIIEGEYRLPDTVNKEGSEIYIDGGIDALWWDRNTQETYFPYNTIIKRITLSGDEEFGFVEERRKRYEIVVTNDTITWNFVEWIDE